MRSLWIACGRIAFWLTWPTTWVYLRIGHRTRIIVVCDNQILLTKSWLSSGYWSLPGGGQHRNEPITEAAKRELVEETGISVEPDELQFLSSKRGHVSGLSYDYSLFIVRLDKLPKTRPQPWEITELQWFSRERISEVRISTDLASMIRQWPL